MDLEKLHEAMGPIRGRRGGLVSNTLSFSHCFTFLSPTDYWDLDLVTTEAEFQQGRQAVGVQAVKECNLEWGEGERRDEVCAPIPVSPQSVL